MKYPASKIIGGSRKKKKVSGLRMYASCVVILDRNKMAPTIKPKTIKMQLSGMNGMCKE
jgi:hypothetical protein